MNIGDEEIKKLGQLARIEVTDAEAAVFQKDLGSILAYIDQIQSVEVGDVQEESFTKNIMREDEDMTPPGIYTEALLASAPGTEDGFIKVKKIL